MTTTTHQQRAIEAARAPAVLRAQCSARQGDLVLERIGEPDATAAYQATPEWGITLIQGEHGEHRLIAAEWAPVGEQRFSLRSAAVVVHTDVPTARHQTIECAPGTWRWQRQQTLTLTGLVAQVAD